MFIPLGVVVEMLSGRVPFRSDTPLGYLRKHMREERVTIGQCRPDRELFSCPVHLR